MVGAVVLAGGAARRLGGLDKPGLLRAGRSLLGIALDAVVDAEHIVVVGPRRPVSQVGITWTREDPPGGGPAAALAAGTRALATLVPAPDGDGLVAVLAADLPMVTRSTIARLAAVVVAGQDDAGAAGAATVNGAHLVDESGRRQPLISVWRLADLRSAVAIRRTWHGVAVGVLLAPLLAGDVPALDQESADVDTPEDAQRWGVR